MAGEIACPRRSLIRDRIGNCLGDGIRQVTIRCLNRHTTPHRDRQVSIRRRIHQRRNSLRDLCCRSGVTVDPPGIERDIVIFEEPGECHGLHRILQFLEDFDLDRVRWVVWIVDGERDQRECVVIRIEVVGETLGNDVFGLSQHQRFGTQLD